MWRPLSSHSTYILCILFAVRPESPSRRRSTLPGRAGIMDLLISLNTLKRLQLGSVVVSHYKDVMCGFPSLNYHLDYFMDPNLNISFMLVCLSSTLNKLQLICTYVCILPAHTRTHTYRDNEKFHLNLIFYNTFCFIISHYPKLK